MADLKRIEDLILKQLMGEISAEEEYELQDWIDESADNKEFMQRMTLHAFRQKHLDLQEINHNRLDRLVKEKLGNRTDVLDWLPDPSKGKTVRVIKYAAAAIVILMIGTICWRASRNSPKIAANSYKVKATLSWHNIISPSKINTESPDSSAINLADLEEGKAFQTGVIQISRVGNEFFIYPERYVNTAAANYKFTVDGINDIQLFFLDSTRVQIYSHSFLAFNTDSSGLIKRERPIDCSGELLFDISHNFRTPLRVTSDRQDIAVLGTRFRIRDFSREDTGGVFCYSGKVSVTTHSHITRTLAASQRATVHSTHELKVSSADFPAAEWSSPELFFDFSYQSLDSAMNEIAHWYGITNVQFQQGIDRTTRGTVLIGKISRYLSLRRLLIILDRSDLHFFVKDQTILVTK